MLSGISYCTKKANSLLGFLQRNLHLNNSDTKAATKTLVQPNLEYFRVTDMLQDLDWETPESRRVKIQLTLLFKVIQDLVDIPASAYLTPASTRTRANHMKKLRQILSKSDAYKHCFVPRTIPDWNSLPATVAKAPDLVSFKLGLSTLTF